MGQPEQECCRQLLPMVAGESFEEPVHSQLGEAEEVPGPEEGLCRGLDVPGLLVLDVWPAGAVAASNVEERGLSQHCQRTGRRIRGRALCGPCGPG